MFKLEQLDESARIANGVNVTYWAIDSSRSATLHKKSKHWQDFEYGDYSEKFILRVAGNTYEFKVEPAGNSPVTRVDGRREYIWRKVELMRCEELAGHKYESPIDVLKDALRVYGGGWMANQEHPDFDVTFNF